MSKLQIINCSNEECQKEFKQREKDSKFCSLKCYKDKRSKNKNILRICLNKDCQEEFIVENKSNKKNYCSRSCATTANNLARGYRTRPSSDGLCKICSIKISDVSEYCKNHYKAAQRENKIQKWLNGEWDGNTKTGLSTIIRDYLLEQANYACEKCGFNTRHPDDGKPVLEINHKDGDAFNSWYINPNNVDKNDKSSNLEVVCPNCHSLSSNYRARNLGKSSRTDRYPDSKIKEIIKAKEEKLQQAQGLLLSTGGDIKDVEKILNKDICECGNFKLKTSNLCHRCNNVRINPSNVPEKDELINIIQQFNHNYSSVAKHYQTNTTTIRRWCKKHSIQRTKN